MSDVLTVFGATGTQGGSVIRSVLAMPELRQKYKTIRGVTRDPSRPGGQKLAEMGVEPVKGDLDDPKSLTAALQGSTDVFAVTNFWESMSYEKELAQGKAISDAALAAGVRHLVWSALPSVSLVTKGKLNKVKHFDAKGVIMDYARSLGINVSFFQPGTYISVPWDIMKGGKQPDQPYTLAMVFGEKDTIPLMDPTQSGQWVAWMLNQGEKIYGKQVSAASGMFTGPEIVEAFKKATGQDAKFVQVDEATFESFMPKGMGEELTEMFVYIRDYGYFGPNTEEQVEQGLKMMVGEPIKLEDYFKTVGA